ncbi:hypothetical protein O7606_09615 [Micromonospora sp. WMMD882]|uniref:hypothetical protein n=1 Tax=Micromonospora sp. WMMD882 TaxID=3015151 RepID=UPI00248CC08E|nr:hypothetical protein [Micromonospora sp. WMMD882]WBB81590.1 hypothetical protein O7606_09615 [Micromonospora sp. WMMD882]
MLLETTERVVAGPTGGRPRRDHHRPSRLTWLLQLYPVSFLVLVPYAILIVPMAVAYDNPDLDFVLKLLGLALASAVVVETLFLGKLGGRGRWQRELARANTGYPRLFLIARSVTVISIVSDVLGAVSGRGSIFTQVTEEVVSTPQALVTSLFSGWRYIALALLVASLVGGRAGRRSFVCWTAALVVAQVQVGLLTGFSGPMISYLSFVITVGAVCGVLRPRLVAVIAVAVFVAWPTLFALRSEIRTDGGVAVDQNQTAADRLRFDLQLTQAAGFDVPVDLDQPGPTDILRYGLLPRLVDSDRPPLTSAIKINEMLFGVDTSAYNFLTLGNIYFFDGRQGVILNFAGWALVVSLLLRLGGGPGPIRLSLFALVVADVLAWSTSYPDSLAGFLQHVVSAVPVLLLIRFTRSRPETVVVGRRVPADLS